MPEGHKIHIQGKDGKNYVVDENWLRQFLGIDVLQNRITVLELKVHAIQKPARMQYILKVLREEGKPRSSNWIQRNIPDFEHNDLYSLESDGKISIFRSGSHRMWKVVEP